MFKSFMKTALAALLLVCATAEARAAQTTVATFHGSVVWANPPAVANGTVEQVSINGAAAVDALHVNVSAKASDPNDVQVLSAPFSLTNGQQYTITYQARRMSPGRIRLR